MAGSRPRVTAAICAYNEAANIGQLLSTLIERDRACFDEIVVVSSGSTDGTDEVVRSHQGIYPRLRLIAEAERSGKARAVNRVLQEASGESILLIDADCVPAEGTLGAIIERLADPGIGGVGSRNVPVNAAESWTARCGAMLWELHHEVNLKRPVLGGDIAGFRNVIESIPDETVNDDYAIELALRQRGFRIAYEGDHGVLMRVPATLRDLIRQRRRIAAGFQKESQPGWTKATLDQRLVATAMLRLIRMRPSRVPWLAAMAAIELAVRLADGFDSLLHRSGHYAAWQPAASTKNPIRVQR